MPQNPKYYQLSAVLKFNKMGVLKMRLTKEQNQNYKTFLYKSIDFEGYDFEQPKTNKDKINKFFECFNSEYGWNIQRVGEVNALIEYLQGLPSSIHIPYANWDIIELAKRFGSLSENATEREEDKIINNYWNFIANKLLQMKGEK